MSQLCKAGSDSRSLCCSNVSQLGSELWQEEPKRSGAGRDGHYESLTGERPAQSGHAEVSRCTLLQGGDWTRDG